MNFTIGIPARPIPPGGEPVAFDMYASEPFVLLDVQLSYKHPCLDIEYVQIVNQIAPRFSKRPLVVSRPNDRVLVFVTSTAAVELATGIELTCGKVSPEAIAVSSRGQAIVGPDGSVDFDSYNGTRRRS